MIKEPRIEKPDDAIIRVTSTAICGSDLHLIHGMVPNMPPGFILRHETMGDIISHRLPLAKAEHGYEIFDAKEDNCIKVVLYN